MTTHQRILVIRPDRIGDVVLATPLIRALRETFPTAYVAVLVRPAVEPVLRGNPRLDAILTDDWQGADADRAGFRRKTRELRAHRFDTALMLLPTRRHAWMTLLAGIRTRIGVGTRLYQVLTLARSVSRHKYVPLRHEADYCLDLGRAIGVRSEDLRTEVFLAPDERAQARDQLASLGRSPRLRLVSVHPESGRSAPNWEPGMYVDFVSSLLRDRDDLQVMVGFTSGNEELRRAFAPLASERLLLPDNGGDLRRLMALIAQADVVVSSSTGPMHLAAALGVPTVSLFCPMPSCSPALWGPRGNAAITLLPPEDYCCKRCPGDSHVCTLRGGIGTEDVIAALASVLPP